MRVRHKDEQPGKGRLGQDRFSRKNDGGGLGTGRRLKKKMGKVNPHLEAGGVPGERLACA